MNLSPTTCSPPPVYGIHSIQDNRATSETNQQFSAVMFESAAGIGAYQAFSCLNSRFFTLAQMEDFVSDFTTVKNLSESGKAEPKGGILSISEKQGTRWQLLKKLEGNVICVSNETFTTHLRENQSDVLFIEAEIDLSELPEQERPLAVEGASFVWTISYFWKGGTRKRESSIYFCRLPYWTTKEATEAHERVRQITDAIQWE
jgi:hypothetical protein